MPDLIDTGDPDDYNGLDSSTKDQNYQNTTMSHFTLLREEKMWMISSGMSVDDKSAMSDNCVTCMPIFCMELERPFMLICGLPFFWYMGWRGTLTPFINFILSTCFTF
ncbi:hypothetical protein ERO13_D03G080351v2 [Gossypium hirsutum]|nr:hypothetical protein ERO13_D03G080351v2 [Gossypium hirsutum]